MTKEKISEPFIVVIDDLGGSFEFVQWCTSEKEARKFYDKELSGEYPDKQGREKRIFKEIEWSSKPNEIRSGEVNP